MTNQLRGVLTRINSETQSAFLPGRIIFDNILIAHELLHDMSHKKGGKNAYMPLKLDMSKAYDRVEWPFLESIMLKFGFSRTWIDHTMSLVSSISYSFLVNGALRGFIRPTKEIRQIDPLLPYLFLLYTEELTMLREAKERRALTGVKIRRESPSINHILFAHDTMLFCKASVDEGMEVMSILQDYEVASGQKINLGKCTVSFDASTSTHVVRREIRSILGMREVSHQGNYLGLPSHIGRSKREVFRYIMEKVEDQMRGWKGKLLSQASKEVMIKAVTSAIPIFVMNYFISVGIIDNLNSLMAKFFWCNAEGGRGIHWKAWDKLCKNKLDGELGFKDLKCMNLTILAKQG
ncbi:hypothetical protein LIER_24375 [Lithospermum erythrorhizon]|uniref:Reverse transcriptase domain-containing protein n=1 Tax=Lithospermum erythrorhizon TaxID=34254 RepID=A0AAV3R145_LITER